jgi:hypothetical protein
LSPKSRRGRALPASRRPKGGGEAAPNLEKVAGAAPVEEPTETQAHGEGKRARGAPVHRKKQHGTAYRWVSAYLPIMAGLFVLLAALWVYTGFINPPPPTPAQQWTRIDNKWSPAREKARQDIAANTLDFAKQQAAYKDFYTQTKGWVDDVTAVKGWGVAANDVTTFLSDGQAYVTLLEQVDSAKTAYEVAALGSALTSDDSLFTADVVTIEQDLALSPGTTAPPLALPSVNATPTPTPSPSASPGASASPTSGASAVTSPATSPTSSPAASPSPSPTAS